MADKENKEIITSHLDSKDVFLRELATIPVKMGFKGQPQEIFTKESQLGLEQKLRLQIMMQESIGNIQDTFEQLLTNTVELAKGFDRQDVVELLNTHQPKTKPRPKNL